MKRISTNGISWAVAWDEPAYTFHEADARPPFQRHATFGFRCVKYFSPSTLPKTLHRASGAGQFATMLRNSQSLRRFSGFTGICMPMTRPH